MGLAQARPNKQFAHEFPVYVGLTQARPNKLFMQDKYVTNKLSFPLMCMVSVLHIDLWAGSSGQHFVAAYVVCFPLFSTTLAANSLTAAMKPVNGLSH